MNLGDVKTRVKRTFGDESGVQVTDGDILRWVNDAQREIVMRNADLLEKTPVATDIISGQQEYTFPTDMRKLRSIQFRRDVTLSYVHLESKSLQEFDALLDGWSGSTYGNANPYCYCSYGTSFKLFPIPDFNLTGGLKLFYYRFSVDVVNDVDELDLPLKYHSSVVEYCLGQAYEMDEDWNSVSNKRNEFNAVVDGTKHDQDNLSEEFYQRITVLPEDQSWEW